MKTNISPLTGFGSLPAFRNTFQFCGNTSSQLRGVEEEDDLNNEVHEDYINHMRDKSIGETKFKKEMLKRKTIWD